MRFVGQTEICALLAAWPEHGDALRAWASEIKYRWWKSAEDLVADFRDVDASRNPVVVFYLVPVGLRIETLINFRLGIVLVTDFRPHALMSARSLETWDARRDH
jgi:mRNA-degrading endonuclease HigB of HigAB toxin-antitoxin module